MAPISPCNASVAWMNTEGVPVLLSVAAIFIATYPDLPSPIVITFPEYRAIKSQAVSKSESILLRVRLRDDTSLLIISFANCLFVFLLIII